jgi:hypothetical protein
MLGIYIMEHQNIWPQNGLSKSLKNLNSHNLICFTLRLRLLVIFLYLTSHSGVQQQNKWKVKSKVQYEHKKKQYLLGNLSDVADCVLWIYLNLWISIFLI